MPTLSALYARVTSLYFIFFFSLSGVLHDLHSFPTRRSSDLEAQPVDGVTVAVADLGDQLPRVRLVDQADTWELRSEEHTSELQSRFDLVCRLLLEKKNARPVRTSAMSWMPPARSST